MYPYESLVRLDFWWQSLPVDACFWEYLVHLHLLMNAFLDTEFWIDSFFLLGLGLHIIYPVWVLVKKIIYYSDWGSSKNNLAFVSGNFWNLFFTFYCWKFDCYLSLRNCFPIMSIRNYMCFLCLNFPFFLQIRTTLLLFCWIGLPVHSFVHVFRNF